MPVRELPSIAHHPSASSGLTLRNSLFISSCECVSVQLAALCFNARCGEFRELQGGPWRVMIQQCRCAWFAKPPDRKLEAAARVVLP